MGIHKGIVVIAICIQAVAAAHAQAQGPLRNFLKRNVQTRSSQPICTGPNCHALKQPVLVHPIQYPQIEHIPTPEPDPRFSPQLFPELQPGQPICTGPNCQPQRVVSQRVVPQPEVVIWPLSENESFDLTSDPIVELDDDSDRLAVVVRATVRVTIAGTCGSGTVVGFDDDGQALVLTNAHVAGSRRGRRVNVERWNVNGKSERGTGVIIAAGYARGMSVDFALLRCSRGFANGVTPIPLADRFPDDSKGVISYGCPRCEWPSMQTLRMERSKGQILKWRPQAIGGRSGSSLVDFSEGKPKVVGLLTWGGGGQGLGQSAPFVLDALRGRLPVPFEALPAFAQEMSAAEIKQAVCLTDGSEPAFRTNGSVLASVMSPQEGTASAEASVIDNITDDGGATDEGNKFEPPDDNKDRRIIDKIRDNRRKDPDTEDDEEGRFRDRDSRPVLDRLRAWIVGLVLMAIGFVVGIVVGNLSGLKIPFLKQ